MNMLYFLCLTMQKEEEVQRKVQLRQTKELLTSFQDGDGSTDDEDLIMSPSIRRDTKKMSKKAMLLDDELF